MSIAAKFFDVGTFGISRTSTHQTSIQKYGIPSMDYVLGLTYNAVHTASFTGHRASAGDITVTAGDQIVVLPDVETAELSMNQQSYSAGFNVITGDLRFGYGGMHGSQFSTIHHPSIFMSLGTNTFRAPHMSFTNPVLQATRNRFIGDTEFVTLFDISREHSSSYNVSLSFNSRYGFAPRVSIGGSRGHSYDEFMPESGVVGDVDIVGSLHNDSVPISNAITGDYRYSQRSPTHSSHSFGFGLSGIGLGSLEEFGSGMSRGIFSAVAGYGAGRLAQSLGLNEFWSSLGGSLASAYTSDAFIRELGGSSDSLSSLGHISESRNGSLLEVELVGFNKQQFNHEVQQIKQSILTKAIEEGVPEEKATKLASDTESKLKEAVSEISSADVTLHEIDQRAKTDVQRKIVEVSDDAPVAEKRRADRENLNTVTTAIRKTAQEKIRVVDSKIEAVEAKKTEISEKLRHIPGAHESAITVLDSMLDKLRCVRDGLIYVVKNPLEAANRAYQIYNRVMDKAADKTIDGAIALGRGMGRGIRFMYDHSIGETYDLVTAKFSRIYHETDFRTAGLDLVEYVPMGIGAAVEGACDAHGIWVTGERELKPTVDKWSNFLFISAIFGKGFKNVAAEVVETATDVKKVAKLTPYGGSGGGHHIHMKSGYKSHPLYDLNKALCLSNQEMARLGIEHNLANIAQRTLCDELKRAGKQMTRTEMNRISVEALVAGGADGQLARSIVARSQWDLKAKGLRVPTDLPWGKK